MSPSYKNLTLRLDSGALIGHSEKLLGDSATGAVLLQVEQAFSRGLVAPEQARRLEHLLHEMHSRAPNAQPLQSIHIGQKRKEPDSAQVTLVLGLALEADVIEAQHSQLRIHAQIQHAAEVLSTARDSEGSGEGLCPYCSGKRIVTSPGTVERTFLSVSHAPTREYTIYLLPHSLGLMSTVPAAQDMVPLRQLAHANSGRRRGMLLLPLCACCPSHDGHVHAGLLACLSHCDPYTALGDTDAVSCAQSRGCMRRGPLILARGLLLGPRQLAGKVRGHPDSCAAAPGPACRHLQSGRGHHHVS